MLAWLLFFAQVQGPPVEVQALVDRARALPPEFSADLQLRLAASRLISETAWKRELIDEAFVTGARAPLPYRQRGEGATDARSSQEVAQNDLEALTLQMRAVEAMLALDPQRAIALYESITPPDPPNVPCTEIITPNISLYYETAAKVFERSFLTKQREKGDDLQFLKNRVASMRSAAQVVPVMRLIFAAKITDVQRQELVTAYAVALDRVAASDRVFGTSEFEVVPAAIPQWRDSPLFVPALRSYIVRHAGGARCSDRIDTKKPPAAVSQFNNFSRRLDPTGVLYKPITAEESKPLKDDGTYKRHPFWQSPRSKQVLDALKWLNHGNRNLPGNQRFWTPEERMTLEWNQHYMDLLKLVEGWKEEEEDSPGDYLWMVAHTYALLAELIPPGTARENAMGNYLTFVETHYSSTANRNLWFSVVRQMLSAAQSNKDPKDREWMLERMVQSKNPIIALYAEMDRRVGPR